MDGKEGEPDVCVIELGGTVGDIESMPFVEAMRQFQFRVGAENFCVIHVSLVPVLGVVGEQKTKPTQHSVAVLRSLGLHPNFLAVRSQEPLKDATRDKLVRVEAHTSTYDFHHPPQALFCQVPPSHVLNMHNVSTSGTCR